MKKLILLILFFLVIFSFCACGCSDDTVCSVCNATFSNSNNFCPNCEISVKESENINDTQEYTLTYIVNGEITNTINFSKKDLPIITNPISQEGLVFSGWFDDSDFNSAPVNRINTIGNKTLYAHFVNNATCLTYETWGGEISITDCLFNVTNVEIPKYINGVPVTKISNDAFAGCDKLKSVIIPDSIKTVWHSAFANCSSLESIYFPNSIEKFGQSVLSQCSSLKEVHLPERLTKIPYSTFRFCTSLTTFDIPDNIVETETQAFEGCFSLTTVNFPNGFLKIGSNTFSRCTSLEEINLPENLIEIGSWAFSGCSSLKTISIPNSVTDIDYGAFQSCSSLVNIYIPESVTEFDKVGSIFSGASSLQSINISENNPYFKSMDGVVYSKDGKNLICYPEGQSDLKFNIPINVTKILSGAFQNNNSLASIYIPKNVLDIEYYAVAYCDALSIYCELNAPLQGWEANWNYSNAPIFYNTTN